MCAYANQTVTPTKIGMGYLDFVVNSVSSPTRLGRVAAISDIDCGGELYEHFAWNADGSKQLVSVFQTGKPVNRYTVTLDEMPDIDLSTYQGQQVDVSLQQCYPKAPTTGWELLAAKAYLRYKNVKPGMETPTQIEIEVIPYNDPGTAVTTFNSAKTL